MRPFSLALAALVAALPLATPAQAGTRGTYEVFGVQGEDLLKLRAGPGLGYKIIVGLPNDTVVHVRSCELIGGTRWCKVYLDAARTLSGYVADAYLREKR